MEKPYTPEELQKVRTARHLLDPPAPEVVGCLLATVDVRDVEISRLDRKWRDYETDYLLPMFRVSLARGFDLQQAVLDNPGKCAGELFFKHFFEPKGRPTMDPLTITIRGKHDTGKTTLARLFQMFLEENDYRHVTVVDIDPLPAADVHWRAALIATIPLLRHVGKSILQRATLKAKAGGVELEIPSEPDSPKPKSQLRE